jgi:hypothetical protein
VLPPAKLGAFATTLHPSINRSLYPWAKEVVAKIRISRALTDTAISMGYEKLAENVT